MKPRGVHRLMQGTRHRGQWHLGTSLCAALLLALLPLLLLVGRAGCSPEFRSALEEAALRADYVLLVVGNGEEVPPTILRVLKGVWGASDRVPAAASVAGTDVPADAIARSGARVLLFLTATRSGGIARVRTVDISSLDEMGSRIAGGTPHDGADLVAATEVLLRMEALRKAGKPVCAEWSGAVHSDRPEVRSLFQQRVALCESYAEIGNALRETVVQERSACAAELARAMVESAARITTQTEFRRATRSMEALQTAVPETVEWELRDVRRRAKDAGSDDRRAALQVLARLGRRSYLEIALPTLRTAGQSMEPVLDTLADAVLASDATRAALAGDEQARRTLVGAIGNAASRRDALRALVAIEDGRAVKVDDANEAALVARWSEPRDDR